MASTVNELASFLESAAIGFKLNGSGRVISIDYPMERYGNERDEHILSMEISLEENGRFFTLAVPRCYNYRELPHKELLLKVLLIVSLFTKMIQFEYDKMSGYIRAVIEFPLEDASLTRKQLLRCLKDMAGQLDEYHHMIISAARENILILPREEGEEIRGLFSEIYKDVLAFESEIKKQDDPS